jgi:Fe2+ transport system protein FeoA
MDDNKGLNILDATLEFSAEEARTEFQWLKMMAAIKYDDYRDFLPGMRFLENLAAWLQQFDNLAERREAYALLRRRLIYVSPPEMQRLVELFYPCVIERRLIEMTATRRGIPKYMVHVDKEARAEFLRLRRRILVLGLSDGARIDILRHSTVGLLSNEQFVVQTQTDRFKWESLLKDLRKAQPDDPDAAFELIVLVDDFTGTGSSFLRYDEVGSRWTGKLCKFLASFHDAMNTVPVVREGWNLCIHHYLGTERAARDIVAREKDAIARASSEVCLDKASHYTFGAIVSQETCISASNAPDAPLVALTQSYYNPKIETEHTKVGGVKHLGLGYGACGLPLILHHNTPNNSLALLWAEEPTGQDETGQPLREMRPLFRRRQRHTV